MIILKTLKILCYTGLCPCSGYGGGSPTHGGEHLPTFEQNENCRFKWSIASSQSTIDGVPGPVCVYPRESEMKVKVEGFQRKLDQV